MKRMVKRFLSLLVAVAAVAAGVRFGPALFVRFFGEGNTAWISQQLSETLREKNELVVYEVETTGIETVTQSAWLLGTVQKVELPYTFSMNFTVDLSMAQVEAKDLFLEVRLPLPKPSYSDLVIDQTRMKKTDWLYPLTSERYAEMVNELETRFFADASQNESYLRSAWETAVHNMESLFSVIVDQSILGKTCEIRVLPLD